MPIFATQGGLMSAIVTILAILLYTFMMIRVGQMRGKHGVTAPATTGHPEFERAFRIHYNTLESLTVFMALLWLATIYFHMLPWLPALVGLIWVIGRFLYMTGYMADPSKRGTGFTIATLSQLALLIIAVIGIVQTWMAANAA
ncbi:MAG TPA: MAPEG family protein [Rhizomicrobium sp.]|nr:MAPEG family protein [Rhizomicrobium sp.]